MGIQPELEQLYRDVREVHLQPLWIDTGSYVPTRPAPRVVTAQWDGSTVVGLLREAGRWISTDLADRRVLVCNNPGLPPFSGTTQTLYACVQLLRPGERTSEHRHSQNAFRFVLSGEGAATTVDGRRIAMHPGDLIVTPAWTWHGHMNGGSNDVIWLDGLDNAIVRLFDATFFEPRSGDGPPGAPETPSPSGGSTPGPYWHFEWATIRRQLDAVKRAGPVDSSHGYRVRYLDPASGADPLPTMTAHMSELPRGFRAEGYRSTDSVIFVVVEGVGRTRLENRTIQWSPNDIFIVPTWEAYHHEVDDTAVLFSFSDRGAQERLGCWREQRDESGH